MREIVGNHKIADDSAFIGKDGALTVNQTTHQIHVHDGSTPGGLLVSGGSGLDITMNITSAGLDRDSATPLSYGYNAVTSGGNNNGVLLPAAVASSVVIVVFAPSGGDPVDIYAQEGETIMGIDDDAQLINNDFQSTIGIFICGVDGDWFTNLTMD